MISLIFLLCRLHHYAHIFYSTLDHRPILDYASLLHYSNSTTHNVLFQHSFVVPIFGQLSYSSNKQCFNLHSARAIEYRKYYLASDMTAIVEFLASSDHRINRKLARVVKKCGVAITDFRVGSVQKQARQQLASGFQLDQ